MQALGEEIDPVWHILRGYRRYQPALALQARLEAMGVRTLVPMHTVWRKDRHTRKRVKVDLPAFGNIVFAEFRQRPLWHVLKEQRIISGVYCRGVEPVVLTPRDLAQVKGFEAIMEEEVSVGDMVTPTAGAIEGYRVKVKDVQAGLALLDIQLLGRDVWLPLAELEVG